jgi:hypothetical protein
MIDFGLGGSGGASVITTALDAVSNDRTANREGLVKSIKYTSDASMQ